MQISRQNWMDVFKMMSVAFSYCVYSITSRKQSRRFHPFPPYLMVPPTGSPVHFVSAAFVFVRAHVCVRPTVQCVESAESINISQSLSVKKLNFFSFFLNLCPDSFFFSEVSQVVSHRSSCAGLEDNKTQVHVFWVIMYEYEYIHFF